MNNKMVERLLYAVMGDTELYTEHDDRELSTIFSAALKQAIPEFKTRKTWRSRSQSWRTVPSGTDLNRG